MFYNDLFREECSDPTTNAQRNLMTRSHYVDPDTLRFHKLRVLSSHVVDNGLLFAIVTSNAADYQNTRRTFRYVIFNIFGTIIDRQDIDKGYSSRKQATQHMWAALSCIDAKADTLAEIAREAQKMTDHLRDLAHKTRDIETKAAA